LNFSILNSTPVNAWVMQLQAATRGECGEDRAKKAAE
jgi:hypothetical protein